MKFATRYEPHPQHQYGFQTLGESMTQQQFKGECDVNNILAKYKKTGLVTHLAKHNAKFGDFSTYEDYQQSLDKILTAQNSFNHLPSELRKKFDNDPGKLIEYLQDEKNHDEAIQYGLMHKIEQPPDLKKAFGEALEENDTKRKKKSTPTE